MTTSKQEVITFDDVMARIQHKIINTTVNPSDDVLYKDLLKDTAYQITVYGLNREKVFGLPDPDIDFPEVVDGLDVIVQDIALLFKKKYRVVEQDMMNALETLPTEDIKLALYLSEHNKLH